MKRHILLVTALLFTSLVTDTARAELLDRGNGLIYDNILDITWMENANYFGETLAWNDAMNWAESLVFEGYNDWRLPESNPSCTGYNCIESEMGNLYYSYNITSDSPYIFRNVRPYMYWSATEYGPDTLKAWRFDFSTGYQGTSSKSYKRYVWAVRNGDSTPPLAPEPAGFALIVTGGLALAAGRLLKKK